MVILCENGYGVEESIANGLDYHLIIGLLFKHLFVCRQINILAAFQKIFFVPHIFNRLNLRLL